MKAVTVIFNVSVEEEVLAGEFERVRCSEGVGGDGGINQYGIFHDGGGHGRSVRASSSSYLPVRTRSNSRKK